MSDSKGRKTLEPLVLRNQSNLLISPAEVADEIENLVYTKEGTLRSVEGPAPLIFDTATNALPSEYSNQMFGVYHTTLRGGATDLLLMHSGNNIYSLTGWTPTSPFKKVVGTAGSLIRMDLNARDTPQFPTQFETTPKGVVIVPQNEGRAVFYDGEVATPLGYDSMPPAALGHGPESTDPTKPSKINNGGYAVSRMNAGFTLHKDFGFGRLGTIEGRVDSEIGGRMLSGGYQCSYQWIDYFGNLSPLAPRSNEVRIQEQGYWSDYTLSSTASPEIAQKQLLWSNISAGPEGTIGRVFSRTKDILNSGTQELFIVPGNVGWAASGAFATMPDNVSTQWPDNVPDGWILSQPHDVMPVPIFKLCRLALGRLWIANTADDPGILIPSMPGRFGTFLRDSEIFPDPSGGAITGMWSTPSGLMVFTATSTFLLNIAPEGQGFTATTLNSNVGCVAPSSLATLVNGGVIWLGREGFYVYDGQQIQLISGHISRETDRINPVRAKEAVAVVDPTSKEYRCWVARDGSRTNNKCFIFDGQGWRTRKREKLQSVCVTKDHRKYVIGAGRVTKSDSTEAAGLWVLDRSVGHYPLAPVKSAIETSWITWPLSKDKKTVKTVYLAFRESYIGSVRVKVYRDWRKKSEAEYEDSTTGTLYLEEDKPPVWDSSEWDDFSWFRNRPFWKKVDVSIPACEVYKIRIESDHPFEFIGMTVDEEPKTGGFGTRIS
tara:strand:+ start:1174 stop:3324 length:2151 start_codon:yes stop_codon:yes gene_type:complete